MQIPLITIVNEVNGTTEKNGTLQRYLEAERLDFLASVKTMRTLAVGLLYFVLWT